MKKAARWPDVKTNIRLTRVPRSRIDLVRPDWSPHQVSFDLLPEHVELRQAELPAAVRLSRDVEEQNRQDNRLKFYQPHKQTTLLVFHQRWGIKRLLRKASPGNINSLLMLKVKEKVETKSWMASEGYVHEVYHAAAGFFCEAVRLQVFVC